MDLVNEGIEEDFKAIVELVMIVSRELSKFLLMSPAAMKHLARGQTKY